MTDDIVLVTGPFTSENRHRAVELAAPMSVRFADHVSDPDVARDAVVAVAGPVSPAEFLQLPRLRWVHSWFAGTDSALFPELVDSHVVLSSSAGNGAVPLAEHAMLLLLMLDRDVPRWHEAQRSHTWDRYRHGELAGSTVGIFGLGKAGIDLARKARAFHMHVVGLRRRYDVPVEGVERIYPPQQIYDFVSKCDHVVIMAPLTTSTRGSFDASVLRAMKPSATLVCVSRGGIVNDGDLLHALSTGAIRAAGLDAHRVEPLPPDSPFWDLPNVIVTPHNGATTTGTLERQVAIFLDNLERFSRGAEMVNVVDKHAGY